MLKIRCSSQFKKDYKKIKTESIDTLLQEVVQFLILEQLLPKIYKDHALIGNWKGYREIPFKARFTLDL